MESRSFRDMVQQRRKILDQERTERMKVLNQYAEGQLNDLADAKAKNTPGRLYGGDLYGCYELEFLRKYLEDNSQGYALCKIVKRCPGTRCDYVKCKFTDKE